METLRTYLPRGLGFPKIRFPTYSQLRNGTYFQQAPPQSTNHQQNWILKEFENKLIAVQEVAVWSSPPRSVMWLLLTQCLLYYLLNSSTPLISTAAYGFLSIYMYVTWVYTVWPTIRVPPEIPEDEENWTPVHPDVLSAPEMSRFLSDTRMKFAEIICGLTLLRQEQPLKFCFFMSLLSGTTAVIGMRFSTTLLIHVVAFLLLVLPAMMIRLSKNASTRGMMEFLAEFISTFTDLLVYRGSDAPPRENRDLDDFVPEVTNETSSFLDKALSFAQVNRENEDLDANLSSGLNEIPSHEEVAAESVMSHDLEADLMPSPTLAIQHGHDHDSSDSEVEKPKEIGDFNESDDDSLGLELEAPTRGKTPVREMLGQMADTVTSSVTGSALMSSASSIVGSIWPQTQPREVTADHELDDFELLSEDELDIENY